MLPPASGSAVGMTMANDSIMALALLINRYQNCGKNPNITGHSMLVKLVVLPARIVDVGIDGHILCDQAPPQLICSSNQLVCHTNLASYCGKRWESGRMGWKGRHHLYRSQNLTITKFQNACLLVTAEVSYCDNRALVQCLTITRCIMINNGHNGEIGAILSTQVGEHGGKMGQEAVGW